MAWRPSCEQGGSSSVHVAPNRVAGRRVAVVPALHRRRDEGSRSVRPIPQPRGSATQRERRPAGSPATLVRLAGHRRDRPPPSAVRTPRCGAPAHTARTARRACLRRPRDRDPRVSSTSGGSPRNVPIGTPPFTSRGDSNGRREERVTGHPQAAPAVARERIPATPNGVERDLGAAVSAVPSGTTTGVARRQSSGRGLAERA